MTTSNQKDTVMTATTTTGQTTTVANPHQIATIITGWAIPLVFLGALWGAGHNPERAEWSAFAVLAIVVIHFVKRAQRAAWKRWGSGE